MHLGAVVIAVMAFKTQRAMLQGFLGERERVRPAFRDCGNHIAIQCQATLFSCNNLQERVPVVVANDPGYLRAQIGRKIMSFEGRPDPLVAEGLASKRTEEGDEHESVGVDRLNTPPSLPLRPGPSPAPCSAP